MHFDCKGDLQKMQDRDKYTIVHGGVPSNTLALFGYKFEGTDYAERKIWLRLLHSFELNRGTGSGDIDSAEAPPLKWARTEDPEGRPSSSMLALMDDSAQPGQAADSVD